MGHTAEYCLNVVIIEREQWTIDNNLHLGLLQASAGIKKAKTRSFTNAMFPHKGNQTFGFVGNISEAERRKDNLRWWVLSHMQVNIT